MKSTFKKFQRSIVFLLKVVLYGAIFSVFFLLFSFEHPQMLNLSRTAGITMITFIALGTALLSIYGGYDIGRQKSKPIIRSLALATLITDVIAYIEFCVMNTNAANGNVFRFADLSTLLLIMILQIFIIVCWTYLGNYVFFAINPPEKVCIVTSSQASTKDIISKIEKYGKQYRVKKVVDYLSDGVYDEILRSDTVFIYDVPPLERTQLVEYCYSKSKNIYYNPEISDVVAVNAEHYLLDDKSFIALDVKELSLEQRFIKRAMDILFSAVALVLASPFMLIITIAIKAYDHGSVLFTQKRATKDGRVFMVYKFRTMKENVENISATEDDDRITPVGKVLRKIRLDELPQIFNILKGDMSIVGPRPEMLENVDRYTNDLPEFSYRLRVKAGLTGYAQIVGKYNSTPKDKLFLDLMYIEKFSIWLDIKLIFQTLTVFLKGDSSEGFKKEEPAELVKHSQEEYEGKRDPSIKNGKYMNRYL